MQIEKVYLLYNTFWVCFGTTDFTQAEKKEQSAGAADASEVA